MSHLVLFFVGSVYFINGLALLGLIEPRSAAPLNIFIGWLLLAVVGHMVMPLTDLSAVGSLETIFDSVGYLLFALTFLYVGVISYTGHPDSGLGWYCAWSAGVSACLAAVQLLHFGNAKGAALWLVWTVVFAALFALIILKANRFERATGWFVITAGFTTCFIPGGLLILDLWSRIPDALVVVTEFAAMALFGILLMGATRKATTLAKRQRT